MAERFGERIRRKRLEQGLGLRQAATLLDISAAYLSRIETFEERTPPAEKVIQAMATLYSESFDELMTLAGRIASDVADYITSDPGLPDFLRSAKSSGLTPEELKRRLSGERK